MSLTAWRPPMRRAFCIATSNPPTFWSPRTDMRSSRISDWRSWPRASATDVTRTLPEGRTRQGAIVGTIAYMSPEQASGESLDARSDIFSFGLVLYEMLAGNRPFSGATDLETLQKVIHQEPEPLGEEFPSALRIAVEKALAKDPAERYQSMRELVVDLRRLVRLKIAETPVALAAGPRRRWLPWTVVVALAAGFGLWESMRSVAGPENPLASATFTRLTDFDANEANPAISPDGKFVAFISDRDGAFDVWLRQVGGERLA